VLQRAGPGIDQLVLQLEGARLLAAQSPADARLGSVIDQAHHLAKSGLQEARWAIGMLRDDELPGPERLAALVEAFERDSGIPSTLTVTGERRDLGSGTRLALYRVAQEALTNIRKHSHPDRAEVWIRYEPAGVRLTIEDFGAASGGPAGCADGPPSSSPGGGAAAGPGGYGLTGMRERAELLGGTLTARATEAGFRVELQVPT
jgi:signal transduction histidine kinase